MRVGIMASIGEGNVGDEAILDGVIARLKSRGDVKHIIVFSHHPTESKRWHHQEGVSFVMILPTGPRSLWRSYRRGSLKKTLKALWSLDRLVIGGGGIFYDQETGVGVNPLLVWFLRVLFLRALGKKVIVHAVGVGPVHGVISKFYLREIRRMSHRFSVRDRASLRLLKSLSVDRPDEIQVVPDPVLTLDFKGSSRRKNYALFILREQYGKKGWLQDVIPKFKFLILFCEKELGLTPVFAPFSLKEPDDRVFLRQLGVTAFEIPDFGAQHWFDLVQRSSLVVSMRLHGQIFAMKAGVPLIALSYSSKTKALSKEYTEGMEMFDANGFEVKDVKKWMRRMQPVRLRDMSDMCQTIDLG